MDLTFLIINCFVMFGIGMMLAGKKFPRIGNFPKKLGQIITNEKFVTLGSQRFYYSNDRGQVVFTCTATFSIGNKGGRKVDLDHDERLAHSPRNHPWYHEICVPFLKKTGYFDTEENAIKNVKSLCEHINKVPQEKKAASENLKEKKDNVLFVEFEKREK